VLSLGALALIISPIAAWSETIAAQGNPSLYLSTGLSVASDEALEVSWTSTNAYNNVSISVSLGQLSALSDSGIAYLTTQIGNGATAATEIASSTFVFPNPAGGDLNLFSGLSLGAGTYYLVLYSTSSIGGGWLVSADPSAQAIVASGAMIGSSGYFYDPGVSVYGDFPYAPSVPFAPTFSNEAFVFSVSGNPVSQTSTPEPASICLVLLTAIGACSAKFMSHALSSCESQRF
jgi:hypothetical protein